MDNKTIKKVVSATVKQQSLMKISQEKRMRSRKWLSWMVWLVITIVSLYITYVKSDSSLDVNLVLKMFGIVTIIYILGNVTEKFVLTFATKLADKIGEKVDSFLE